ncbi:hypothetical protein M427DRAFT_58443 [Gonapodya prolifera JEL478]|uniref:Snf2 ATP coupling domain-containing protein n=1 Tax=Gonapodya prolifera (strain JEL478) TaxID=1344416 RepID=A0A139AAY1_GONPJ|nr:hypothetical protein M427DRAFT_58443 [Gonapodya prolifera JEL478]|eukprot:KXS13625.1 hypothetical protein M427DRAFT_58443 [Gonapodya prolifera JEL478]
MDASPPTRSVKNSCALSLVGDVVRTELVMVMTMRLMRVQMPRRRLRVANTSLTSLPGTMKRKELFRAMDREMEERDALEWNARGQRSKGRFIQPDQVPEIVLKDQRKVVKVDNPHTFGRGSRKREGATLNEKDLAKKQWEDSEDGSDEGEASDGTEDTHPVRRQGEAQG